MNHPEFGEDASLDSRIELLVPDDHLSHREPAPRNHGTDYCNHSVMQGCEAKPTVLIGLNQV